MAAISGLIRVMERAARKAGGRLRRDFGEVEHLQVSRKGPADFVSKADIRAERTLYDGFQTYYQRTPHDMLTRFRLEAARRLIRDSGVPVADAARRVGIRHLGRFSATYREAFGVLPSADAKPGH